MKRGWDGHPRPPFTRVTRRLWAVLRAIHAPQVLTCDPSFVLEMLRRPDAHQRAIKPILRDHGPEVAAEGLTLIGDGN